MSNGRFKSAAQRGAREWTDPWACFELHALAEERALRIRYDPNTETWSDTEIIRLKCERSAFARGAMRECFRAKKMSSHERSDGSASSWKRQKNYVLKRYMECDALAGVDPEVVLRDDLKMQLKTKALAEEFDTHVSRVNVRGRPAESLKSDAPLARAGRRPRPLGRQFTGVVVRTISDEGEEEAFASELKQIDVLDAYLLRMVERPGQPLLWCEAYVDGPYVKHQNNAGSVLEVGSAEHHRLRLTPQAFSHWTFDRSGGRLIVVDMQGVDDLYTDPQIHTAGGAFRPEFGVGNLGTPGIALFFMSHRCNIVCERLGLRQVLPPRRSVDFTSSELVAPSARASYTQGGRSQEQQRGAVRPAGRSGAAPASAHGDGALAAWLPSDNELVALELACGAHGARWGAQRRAQRVAVDELLLRCQPCESPSASGGSSGGGSPGAIDVLAERIEAVYTVAALEHLRELEAAVQRKAVGWELRAARCRRRVMVALGKGGGAAVALCRGLREWVRSAPRAAVTFHPAGDACSSEEWFDEWALLLDREFVDGSTAKWATNDVGRARGRLRILFVAGCATLGAAAAAFAYVRWLQRTEALKRQQTGVKEEPPAQPPVLERK
jgi:hypothetical protein